jgi:hypothetical protein
MVEGDHEGNDEDFLLEHEHYKIRKTPSHTLKIIAINNI